MDALDRPVVVFGATGQQGGSVAHALKADGWCVRAFVRQPASAKAKALAAAGIETVQGDQSDPASVAAAVAGAYGVFSVQPSSGQLIYGITDADEIRYGKSIADAAVDAGVEHLVYSSAAGAVTNSGVGHFETKWQLEEFTRSLHIDSTIIRPATFMEVLLMPDFGFDAGEITFFMQPDERMQLIAVEDIGKITAKLFAGRAIHRGRSFDIAGDSVSGTQLAAEFGAATSRSIAYRRFPDEVLRDSPFLSSLVRLVERGPLAGRADLGEIRKLCPGLLTLGGWLRKLPKPALLHHPDGGSS